MVSQLLDKVPRDSKRHWDKHILKVKLLDNWSITAGAFGLPLFNGGPMKPDKIEVDPKLISL